MAANKKWDSSHTFEQINILSHYSKDEWKIYINDFNPELENVFRDTMKELGLTPNKYHVHKADTQSHKFCILEAIYIGNVPPINHDLIRSKLELLTTYEATTD